MRRDLAWGMGLRQTADPNAVVSSAAWAEANGFSRLWYGNEKLYPDMTVGLTLAANATHRIGIGPFVTDPFSVHPAITATAAATLAHLAPERVVLLVGAGGSGLRELGIERTAPAKSVEQAVGLMKRLLAGQQVSGEAGPYQVVDSGLHFEMPCAIPIWVASRGRRVLEAAGRCADGAMIGTFARPAEVARARDWVWAGVQSAGRQPGDVRISVRVDVAISDDAADARDALRPFIAGVLSASYPDRGFVQVAGVSVPDELEAVCASKDIHLAWSSGHLVTDELVDAFSWAGTPADVVARARSIVDMGIDEITVLVHETRSQTTDEARQAFVEGVMDQTQAPAAARSQA